MTATVTDNDGDKASASIDLGPQIQIHDDGPSVTATASGLPTLSVDESFIPVIGVVGSGTGPAGSNVATGAFGADFTVVAGADGQNGATAYTLTLNNGLSSEATTLIDSKTGGAVTLVQISPTEVDARDAASDTVFTLTVNAAGQVTMTDLRGVHEGSGETPDISEFLTLASGLVSVTATVTDNDGDKASASIDLGPQIQIHDDGPSVTATASGLPTLSVDESFIPVIGVVGSGTGPAGSNVATGAFGADFTVVAGADGQNGATAYTLTLNNGLSSEATTLIDSKTGGAVTLVQISPTEVDARDAASDTVFTLTVNAAGQVTMTDLRGVHEGSGETPDISEFLTLASGLVSVTATVTDNDGDKASASIDLGPQIQIHDDGPSVTATATGLPTLSVDESFIPVIGVVGFWHGPCGYECGDRRLWCGLHGCCGCGRPERRDGIYADAEQWSFERSHDADRFRRPAGR